jgi:hypothetical protein
MKNLMSKSTDDLLDDLSGNGSDREWEAVHELRKRLSAGFASKLLEKYKSEKSWKARAAFVYHSIRYAKDSDDALTLGILALYDKSKVVRYRAAMLLACSLKTDILVEMEKALTTIPSSSHEDIRAAIDAITHQNQNYFIDRSHSEKIFLNM